MQRKRKVTEGGIIGIWIDRFRSTGRRIVIKQKADKIAEPWKALASKLNDLKELHCSERKRFAYRGNLISTILQMEVTEQRQLRE